MALEHNAKPPQLTPAARRFLTTIWSGFYTDYSTDHPLKE